MIGANVELIGRVLTARRKIESTSRRVRQRIERQEVEGLFGKTICRDDIARKRIAERLSGPGGIASNRRRINEGRSQFREVASAHSGRWDRRVEGQGPANTRPFKVAKNKGAVLAVIDLRQ